MKLSALWSLLGAVWTVVVMRQMMAVLPPPAAHSVSARAAASAVPCSRRLILHSLAREGGPWQSPPRAAESPPAAEPGSSKGWWEPRVLPRRGTR